MKALTSLSWVEMSWWADIAFNNEGLCAAEATRGQHKPDQGDRRCQLD